MRHRDAPPAAGGEPIVKSPSPPLRRATAVLVVAMLTAGVAGCAASKPGAPSPNIGATMSTTLPDWAQSLTLTDEYGKPQTLAALHGKIVVLTDILTLCQDMCPLVTANLRRADLALTHAGLADRVQFVEVTVDPKRDTPARLHAYRAVAQLLPNFTLLTGAPADLERLGQLFGYNSQITAEGSPPAIDWLTGKPLTYDVSHGDVLVFLDAAGRERFVIAGGANTGGQPVAPKLQTFLSDDGKQNITHPDASSWTTGDVLAALSWMVGKKIKPAS